MRTRKAVLLMMFCGLLFSAHAAVFAHPSYSSVVVFGDSLSDPGNAFALTGTYSIPPYNLIPSAPYAIGSMHFSNGKTWAEILTGKLGGNSGPAFRNPLMFSNYAIGGARARSVTGADLTDQVSLYLSEHDNRADPNALYVVLIGGNDIRDAIVAYQMDTTGDTSTAILGAALQSEMDNLQSLASAGAKYFLIGNAPDLSLVPAVSRQGSLAQYFAQKLSRQYNTQLQVIETNMTEQFPIDVATLDLYAVLHSLEDDPQQIGLTDVTDTCIHPGVVVKAVCSDSDDYLFWDGIHPTHTVHAFLARQALKALH